jgi:DNA-binding LacI/PurR family transcriptional regulator
LTIRNNDSVTIQDVARAAGVSIATVSRVKNNSFLVSQEKRELVHKAMGELGYSFDIPSQQKKGVKAVLVIAGGFHLLENILNGIMDAAKLLETNYCVTTFNPIFGEDGYRDALEAVRLIPRELLGGLILYHNSCTNDEIWGELQQYPLVQIGEYRSADPCFAVVTDDYEAEEEITAYLIGRGRRRLAFLGARMEGGSRYQFDEKREAGFRNALRKAKLPIDESLVFQVDFAPEGGIYGARRLMEQAERPDAIVCASDQIALGVLGELRRLGVSVPSEAAVAGFDDMDFVEFLSPSLTTVRQSYWEMGAEALRLLDALKDPIQIGRIVNIKHSLSIRESSG